MKKAAHARALLALFSCTCGLAWAALPVPSTDPLAAIDMNRNAIIADIVQGFEGDRAVLARRLGALRADRLLSASLASTRESLESILGEAEKSRDATPSRTAKVLGSANSDLVYTPIAPCRLIDTRGLGAPIQGGPFAPNERRAYVPNGLCGLPTIGVASMLISFTTLNLTPNSGGYLSVLGPGAPVTTSVDIFNFGTSWSGSNTAVATGPAAQFDVFVSTANPQVVIDILGYFAPPQGTVVKSITAGTGLTGGTITDTGTVALAPTYQLPQACTNGQVPQSNGAGGWGCVTPPTPTGGTLTAVTASAPLASSGGSTPDISLTGGAVGQVLAGTAGAPAWTSSPSLGGNLVLVDSTSTAGNIMKGSSTFIHNSGLDNTFVGKDAGNLTMSGGSNAGIGSFALQANTAGNFNTALGHFALKANASGNDNTAVGTYALQANTTGVGNSAVGRGAMLLNTTGAENTASGNNALLHNETGSNNTATGSSALLLSTGDGNSAFGSVALTNNTIGSGNTAVGNAALQGNTTGGLNTAVGRGALPGITTGSNNIALGANAGLFFTGASSDNIVIGHPGGGGNNAIRIGNFQTRTYIAGIRDVTTSFPGPIPVLVGVDGQLGTASSSRRYKDDIADMDAASDALMKLRPVTFHYKSDHNPAGRMLQYGLIAEEVDAVYPGLVAHSADGQVETVMYQYLPPMLLNEVQKQQRTIHAQAARIDALEKLVGKMALERMAPVNVVRQ